MDDRDFQQARSALNGALTVAGPILAALQQADKVFDTLANAEKYQQALQSSVKTLQAQVQGLREQQADLAAALAAAHAEVETAQTASKETLRALKADEAQAVAQAQAHVASQVLQASMQGNDAMQAMQTRVDALREETDTQISALVGNRAALEAEVGALEAKLATLTASARKFAAALAGD